MASSLVALVAESRKHRLPQVIVIDENPAILDYFRQILDHRTDLLLLSLADDALEQLRDVSHPALILMDFYLGDDATGSASLALLAEIRKRWPFAPVVMMSCSENVREVIRASQLGSVAFILKPFHQEDIEMILRQYVEEEQGRHPEVMDIPLDENHSFVRASQRMREVEAHCRLVATTDIPILILGESGTGKEIIAMFIHQMSERSNRSFLKVNCAAMPLDLLESELFGYEQGAFTGAMKSKPGKFELCNHGTIFLDEIGEMPPALQAKLLQVLQDGTFSRLGSRTTMKVDVRVIAATNINIKDAIVRKAFREDLYYRLNGFSIHLPPLRERREEIPILINYFMSRNAAKFERDPLPLSSALLQALTSYSWPGNLRELENTMKRYLILADEQAIISELHPGLGSCLGSSPPGFDATGQDLKRIVRGVKGDAESVLIARTLEKTNWNRKAAAVRLQISYKALLYKIRQYGLAKPEAV